LKSTFVANSVNAVTIGYFIKNSSFPENLLLRIMRHVLHFLKVSFKQLQILVSIQ